MQASAARTFGIALLAFGVLSGCHPNWRGSSAGRTPPPGPSTSHAQANSTNSPSRAVSLQPGAKYYAITGRDNGVQFGVWANGRPLTMLNTGGKNVDITKMLRSGSNEIAVTWTKVRPKAHGTISINQRTKPVFTVRVSPGSPRTGKTLQAFTAPHAVTGTGPSLR